MAAASWLAGCCCGEGGGRVGEEGIQTGVVVVLGCWGGQRVFPDWWSLREPRPNKGDSSRILLKGFRPFSRGQTNRANTIVTSASQWTHNQARRSFGRGRWRVQTKVPSSVFGIDLDENSSLRDVLRL